MSLIIYSIIILSLEFCMQSGQIHFYNTRTHKRTSRDPRRRSSDDDDDDGDDDGDDDMSLELQLNLPCESLRKSWKPASADPLIMESSRQLQQDDDEKKNMRGFEEAAGDHNQEMIATVCTRCHMLVMLCKSCPACPSCKFMHPPIQDKLYPPLVLLQNKSVF